MSTIWLFKNNHFHVKKISNSTSVKMYEYFKHVKNAIHDVGPYTAQKGYTRCSINIDALGELPKL